MGGRRKEESIIQGHNVEPNCGIVIGVLELRIKYDQRKKVKTCVIYALVGGPLSCFSRGLEGRGFLVVVGLRGEVGDASSVEGDMWGRKAKRMRKARV